MAREKCVVCGQDNRNSANQSSWGPITVDCPRCGKYKCHEEAWDDFLTGNYYFGGIQSRKRANLSGFIRENQGMAIKPQDCEWLINIKTPSFFERSDKLLRLIENKTNYAGEFVNIIDEECMGFSWALNAKELKEIAEYLVGTKRLKRSDGISSVDQVINSLKIAPDGWTYLEKLREMNPDSKQGFIAMWFDDSMEPAKTAIRDAIVGAGFNPHLVSDREHTGKICDEIIAQIRRSRFVVADFTDHRGGVYFEAGFALGLGLPVIWTCKKEDMGKLHFDIRQYNCIDWMDSSDLRERLQNRIMALFAK